MLLIERLKLFAWLNIRDVKDCYGFSLERSRHEKCIIMYPHCRWVFFFDVFFLIKRSCQSTMNYTINAGGSAGDKSESRPPLGDTSQTVGRDSVTLWLDPIRLLSFLSSTRWFWCLQWNYAHCKEIALVVYIIAAWSEFISNSLCESLLICGISLL